MIHLGPISAALSSPVLVPPQMVAGNRAYNYPDKNKCVFKLTGISVDGGSNYQEQNVRLGSEIVRYFYVL